MKVTFLLRCAGLIAVCLFICSCSFIVGEKGVFKNNSRDYLKSGSLKPISVPNGVENRIGEPLYRVPSVLSRDEFGDTFDLVEYEVPAPSPINTDKGSSGVKIQKLNADRWIFAKAPTAQIWPRTQNFLSEYGISVYSSNPSTGLIETGWVSFKDDAKRQSRFLIRVEKGIHEDASEIHIRQIERASSDVLDQEVTWPEISMNAAREKWMIDGLAQELVKNVDNSSASLLGQNVGGTTKALFAKSDGEPSLALRLSQGRAWASLIHSARMEGFRTWESNENLGLIYVAYDENLNEKKGFFRKLAFWANDEVVPDEAPNPLPKVIKSLANDAYIAPDFAHISVASHGEPLPNGQGFLIIKQRKDDISYVTIRDHRGRILPMSELKNLLRILRKNLI